MVFTTDVKEKTQLGPTVVYSSPDVKPKKKLQRHLLIYHSLHVKSRFQALYDNAVSNIGTIQAESTLMKITNSNLTLLFPDEK